YSVAQISTPISSKIRCPSWVSFKIHRSFYPRALSKRNVQFINHVVRLESEGSLVVGKDNQVSEIRKKNLAVFVSGGGSNFRSIYEASLSGSVQGDIAVLVTNKPECGGADFARQKGIPVYIVPKMKDVQEENNCPFQRIIFQLDYFATSRVSENLLVLKINKLKCRHRILGIMLLRFELIYLIYKVDFVLLAGYLKLIPTELIRAFPNSILNIHPSLLPAFGGKGYYGIKVHKAVIASGARYETSKSFRVLLLL
ncbi:phosphoribosylglycinamide formyltransferase, chloroplastic-like, partial [Henckelia pumila]|uniref:phosphoribosylglycinamide formyltransferase, chloroplastic-like n=1 Tax=Henckelia pumila TaxID=405737 RepID=UPI003C6E60CB